jgi:hypothetical protein
MFHNLYFTYIFAFLVYVLQSQAPKPSCVASVNEVAVYIYVNK